MAFWMDGFWTPGFWAPGFWAGITGSLALPRVPYISGIGKWDVTPDQTFG